MQKAILAPLVASVALWVVAAQRGEGPPRRISNPQTIALQHGSRVEFGNFPSRSLGSPGEFSVFLPPSYGKKADTVYPVVYFLHGMFNDHTSWAVERYGNIPQRIDTLINLGEIPEILIVHPNGRDTFYTNHLDGSIRSEDFIHKDLVEQVEKDFKVRSGKQWRSVGGVSMGAYGALKIALKFPEKFAAVAAISPIVLLGKDPSAQILNSNSRVAVYFRSVFEPIFGIPFDITHWQANSLETLVPLSDIKGLRIYFSYGTADRYNAAFPMEAGVQALDRMLKERGARHVFKSYEGEPHGWELVNGHLDEVLTFLTQPFLEH